MLQNDYRLLSRASGYELLMTRTDDTFVDLEARPRFATKKNADLFLSIHFNAAINDTAEGVETYAMNIKRSSFYRRAIVRRATT